MLINIVFNWHCKCNIRQHRSPGRRCVGFKCTDAKGNRVDIRNCWKLLWLQNNSLIKGITAKDNLSTMAFNKKGLCIIIWQIPQLKQKAWHMHVCITHTQNLMSRGHQMVNEEKQDLNTLLTSLIFNVHIPIQVLNLHKFFCGFWLLHSNNPLDINDKCCPPHWERGRCLELAQLWVQQFD